MNGGGKRKLDPEEPRLSAWERKMEWPLILLALAFLGIYAWQALHVNPPFWLFKALNWAVTVIWALFAADYFYRLYLARRKWRYVRTHLFDLAVVLLPMLRQLRVLQLITVMRAFHQPKSGAMRNKMWIYIGTVMAFAGLISALAVLDAEREAPDATITSFPDALWWSVTTMSTVGYGDTYPVTSEGRLIAAAVMIGGVALLGVVTGTIASWFVEKLSGAEDAIEAKLTEEVRALRDEIAELRTERVAGVSPPGDDPPR